MISTPRQAKKAATTAELWHTHAETLPEKVTAHTQNNAVLKTYPGILTDAKAT